MTDRRMFPAGSPLSPSGWVVSSACGRRAVILKAERTRGACTWCARPVAGKRSTWCSTTCVEAFLAMDPNRLRRAAIAAHREPPRAGGYPGRLKPCQLCSADRYAPEVDHTVPIVEGGHPWDPANLRVICTSCHRAETRALAARRALARRSTASPSSTTSRVVTRGGSRSRCSRSSSSSAR